jgi:hypothetical protein
MSELKRSQARPDDSDGGKRQDLTAARAPARARELKSLFSGWRLDYSAVSGFQCSCCLALTVLLCGVYIYVADQYFELRACDSQKIERTGWINFDQVTTRFYFEGVLLNFGGYDYNRFPSGINRSEKYIINFGDYSWPSRFSCATYVERITNIEGKVRYQASITALKRANTEADVTVMFLLLPGLFFFASLLRRDRKKL